MTDFVCIAVPYVPEQQEKISGAVGALHDAGIAAELNAPWVEIEVDFASAPDPVTAVNRGIARAIAAHPDKVPLIFGVGCHWCVGAVKGLEAHHPAVLWYDAHGDFNTHATTISGYLDGMALATLVGRDNQNLMQGVGLSPIDERDVVITDSRDLDPAEGDALRASQVTLLTDVAMLMTHPLPDKPLYIHFDSDVLNLDEMPAMNHPAKGGPAVADVIVTLRRVLREYKVAGILFNLWDNALPGADLTRHNALKIVRAIAQEMND